MQWNRILKSRFYYIAIIGLISCTDFSPYDALRFDPPPEYERWWDAAQSCVSQPHKRRYDDIEWYHTDIWIDGHPATTVNNKIYIVPEIDMMQWVIVHELVHAVDDIHGHPYDPFTKCHLMDGVNYNYYE